MTETSLSLEAFRRYFNFHPYHFWQMGDLDVLKVTPQCNPVVYEYAYQSLDRAGRQDILLAIASAEALLTANLGYSLGARPVTWTVPWPRLADATMRRVGAVMDRGDWLSVFAPEGSVYTCGVRVRTLIQSGATVLLSDEDNDGVFERFSVTVSTSVTDADSLALYFTSADRVGGDVLDESDRIRPVTTVISGGTATIRGDSWLLVRPAARAGLRAAMLNPATAGVLATTVDVYAVTINTNGTTEATAQCVIVWESRPVTGWWCSTVTPDPYSGAPYDPAATARAVGRVGLRDARRGVLLPAQAAYDASTGTWSALAWDVTGEPDRVIVHAIAGEPLIAGDLDPQYVPVVARLAAAELGRPVCACEAANRELMRWQEELSDLPPTPFGSRRGHHVAWQWIQDRFLMRGMSI